jgi:hypothetical protein
VVNDRVMHDAMMMMMPMVAAMMGRRSECAERDRGENGRDEDLETET